MGSTSSSLDWKDTTNDFELVVRIAKELDQTLNEEFGAHKDLSLGEKITYVEDKESIERLTLRYMWNLVKWRNALVHEYHCNSLEDLHTSRSEFRERYTKVKEDLKVLITQKNSQTTTCNIAPDGWPEVKEDRRYTTLTRSSQTAADTTSGWFQAAGILAVAVGGMAVAAALDDDDRKKKDSSGRGRNNRLGYY